MEHTIIIATNNKHKAKEFGEIFQNKGITFKTLDDFPEVTDIEENGNTFEENATIKAMAVHKLTKLPVLADDSGLEVTSLNGEPGVHSARYAGDHDDTANNQKLLQKLSEKSDRSARFVTCLVLINEHGDKLVVYGTVNGQILEVPRGDNGFGYDPLFYIPIKGKTLAEMSNHDKNTISHRGNAIRKLSKKFDGWWNE